MMRLILFLQLFAAVLFSIASAHSISTDGRDEIKEGRKDSMFPSPRCCQDGDCLANDKKRYAVITLLRTQEYLPVVRNFICSIHESNPTLPVMIATVKGDLTDDTIKFLESLEPLTKVIFWEDVIIDNKKNSRYRYNWVKLRAWAMTEYDALMVIDSDTLVVGNLVPVFSIPAHFACVLDEDKFALRYSSLGAGQGGVIFLRPCPAVMDHMLKLLHDYEELQFVNGHAEQTFLDWYFRYERLALPVAYNAIFHLLDNDLRTRSGTKAVIIHYTRKDVQSAWMNLNYTETLDLHGKGLGKGKNLCERIRIDHSKYLNSHNIPSSTTKESILMTYFKYIIGKLAG